MKDIVLEAELRAPNSSKGTLSALRAQDKIPAVVYGGSKEPISIIVSTKALRKATQKAGLNAIMTLKHPKGEDTVILKEVSHHVVNNKTIHVDFQRISLTEKIKVRVQLKVVGEAPGVKLQGGILEHILREVEVKCLPTAIPHEINVDVSALGITQSIHLRDVKAPEGVEMLMDPGQTVVSIVAPAAEEAAPAAAAGAAAAEPEISVAKGKKEEEGAEGAKAAAPAEKGKAPEKKEEKK